MTRRHPCIGIVGNAGAGKDFVAERIAEHYGYVPFCASDLVREEIRKAGLPVTREQQTRTANQVREQRGVEYFMVEALARATALCRPGIERPLLTGIYSPGEGAYIQKIGGLLVCVTPSIEDDSVDGRFSAVLARADGDRDRMDRQDFLAAHARENAGQTPAEANVATLAEMADVVIENNRDPAYLRWQLDGLFKESA